MEYRAQSFGPCERGLHQELQVDELPTDGALVAQAERLGGDRTEHTVGECVGSFLLVGRPRETSGPKAARGAMANQETDKDGRIVVKGQGPYTLPKRHGTRFVIDIPTFTLVFMTPPGDKDSEYPKFFLVADDKTYQERSVGRDLVLGRGHPCLVFTWLKKGRKFTLIRRDAPDHETIIFEDVPYESLVDQHRPQVSKFLDAGGVRGLDLERVREIMNGAPDAEPGPGESDPR